MYTTLRAQDNLLYGKLDEFNSWESSWYAISKKIGWNTYIVEAKIQEWHVWTIQEVASWWSTDERSR